MEENTKSENPEDPLKKEERSLNEEELSENSQPDPQFEEQEGEVLPPEEKKNSGAGKLFFLLILVLSGSGGYLYFNNLIPPEILDLVLQKPARSKPPALVVDSPSLPEFTLEEEPLASTPGPLSVTPEVEEKYISGRFGKPESRISGSGLNHDPDVKPEKDLRETARGKKTEPVAEKAMIEEREVILEPAAGKILPSIDEESSSISEEPGPAREKSIPESDPSSEKPGESPEKRNKAVQAYLDFIETSAQKLGGLIRDGFYWLRDSLGKIA